MRLYSTMLAIKSPEPAAAPLFSCGAARRFESALCQRAIRLDGCGSASMCWLAQSLPDNEERNGVWD